MQKKCNDCGKLFFCNKMCKTERLIDNEWCNCANCLKRKGAFEDVRANQPSCSRFTNKDGAFVFR